VGILQRGPDVFTPGSRFVNDGANLLERLRVELELFRVLLDQSDVRPSRPGSAGSAGSAGPAVMLSEEGPGLADVRQRKAGEQQRGRSQGRDATHVRSPLAASGAAPVQLPLPGS
jgi:hypothetical protein